MRIMVYTLLGVMQDLYHPPYYGCSSGFRRDRRFCVRSSRLWGVWARNWRSDEMGFRVLGIRVLGLGLRV